MKTRLCLLVVLAAGCGSKTDRQQGTTQERIALLKELNDTLATVKDQRTLREATPWVEKLCGRLAKNAERRKELGDAAQPDYAAELARQNELLGVHMKRIESAEAIGRKSSRKLRELMKNVAAED